MLVPLTVLLSPGWEVTNSLTSQFSPTGIHRYPQGGGVGVLTPSRPPHIAQTGHIIPSKVKEERRINPKLTTLSSSTGLYCTAAPWQGVSPSLSLPHMDAPSLLWGTGINPFLTHSSEPHGHQAGQPS